MALQLGSRNPVRSRSEAVFAAETDLEAVRAVNQGVERAGEFLHEQVNGDWNGDDFPVRGKAAKLLLTDSQKTMIRNFNQSLPQLERIVVCESQMAVSFGRWTLTCILPARRVSVCI